MTVLAHGIGGVKDLPVPDWLFSYGGAVVLVVSFVALGVLWDRPRLERARERPLPEGLQRLLLSPALRVAVGAVSVFLLGVVLAAAAVGLRSTTQNLAPTFVWIVFWLGLVPFAVLFGNVWAVVSPFRAVADAVAWAGARAGVRWEPLPYPERLGRWPAAVLLLAFVTLELAYADPADPRALALAAYLYAAITWFGMFAFGRRAWLENGEAFHVYFGLFGLVAPFGARTREDGRRELVVRPPLSGLARFDPRRGTVAFVAVMLGSVAFDSVSRMPFWLELQADLADSGGALFAVSLAGLLALVAGVALAYLGAVAAARRATRSELPLARAFVGSLVPIALVYVVAHYFSLAIGTGQYVIPLASDPFGYGWNLFGTSAYVPSLAPLSPNTVWYVQVGALVAGHVLGLVLAHDRAVALFRSPRRATRSQYAMLVLMVLYTVGGLWLLSSG